MITSMWLTTARALLEQSVPILALSPGLKKPVARPHDKSWWTCDDPSGVDLVEQAVRRVVHGQPNLGMLLGWEKDSPVCAVDLDVHHNAKAPEQAQELGVNSKDSVWAARTGRGGYHVFYRLPHGFSQRRSTAAAARDGSGIDLLVNGYAVISPSDTSREAQGGGPYQWVTGHSPFDLSLVDLPLPPAQLLAWWQDRLDKTPANAGNEPSATSSTPHLDVDRVLSGVAEGERNETLFRYASSLRARGVRRQEAEALVLQVAARCTPPMADSEAITCLDSAWKYPDGYVPGVSPLADERSLLLGGGV